MQKLLNKAKNQLGKPTVVISVKICIWLIDNSVFVMTSIPFWTNSVVKAISANLPFLAANPTDLRL